MSGYNLPGGGIFVFCMGIAAISGWVVIEFIIWVFSFVKIYFGG
ncbi:TMhelix containing protein [Vibrio phage 1.049.O._10N.286.54.B5]|nr:TMhelix containing protein [Vibrio phage 1.049.O._10N.286.54.B5]AUR84216.1 TMhelix containing protein [Vibrio phage 1.050.O._10N.286.48.A6]